MVVGWQVLAECKDKRGDPSYMSSFEILCLKRKQINLEVLVPMKSSCPTLANLMRVSAIGLLPLWIQIVVPFHFSGKKGTWNCPTESLFWAQGLARLVVSVPGRGGYSKR